MIANDEGLVLSSDWMFLCLLFLFAVDFLDLSGMLIAGIILLFLFLRFPEIRFDTGARILVLFSAFYFGSVAFYEGLTIDVVIKFAIAPWGCYLLGYNLRLSNRSLSVTDYALIVAFGFFIHGMLNLVAGIQVFGVSLNNNYRQAFDFWQKRTISVTTASLYYTPFTVMAIGAVFHSRRRLVKLMSLASVGLGLYASMIYQNLTLILACGLVMGLNVLMVTRDGDARKKRRVYGVLAAGVLAVVLAFAANVGGIRDTILNSSLFNRMSGDKQDRTTIWISFIFGEAWKYPFGGTRAVLYNNKPFVHNMWLDCFRRGGLFPFLLLGTFTLRSIRDALAFGRLGKLTGEETGVIISLLAGTMLSFMVEPVIEANPYVFYLPLFVIGMINGHNRDVKMILEDCL